MRHEVLPYIKVGEVGVEDTHVLSKGAAIGVVMYQPIVTRRRHQVNLSHTEGVGAVAAGIRLEGGVIDRALGIARTCSELVGGRRR